MTSDLQSKRAPTFSFKALARHLSISLGTVLLMLVLLEQALRLFDALGWFPEFYKVIGNQVPTFASRTGPGLYYAHPYTAYAMKPGYSSYDPSTGQRQTINSLGFRGPEITREKPPGTYRIVALGASTTYANYLSDEDTYPLLLEKELRSRLRTDAIEVVNAGMTGATSAESMHRMFTDILPLHPDMLIYYEGYNDLIPRMYNDYSDDYYSFRRTPRDVEGLSRFYLYRLWKSATSEPYLSPLTGLVPNISKLENLPVDDKGKRANFRSTTSAVYMRNVDYIILLAQAKAIQVVLATFAFDDNAPNWNTFMPDSLWGRGIAQNNQAIQELAAEYHLPLLDWAARADGRPELFGDSIHMNAYGDAQQAAFFAESLQSIVAQAMGRQIQP